MSCAAARVEPESACPRQSTAAGSGQKTGLEIHDRAKITLPPVPGRCGPQSQASPQMKAVYVRGGRRFRRPDRPCVRAFRSPKPVHGLTGLSSRPRRSASTLLRNHETLWFLSLFCLFAFYPPSLRCQLRKTGRGQRKPVFHKGFVVPSGTHSVRTVQPARGAPEPAPSPRRIGPPAPYSLGTPTGSGGCAQRVVPRGLARGNPL